MLKLALYLNFILTTLANIYPKTPNISTSNKLDMKYITNKYIIIVKINAPYVMFIF